MKKAKSNPHTPAPRRVRDGLENLVAGLGTGQDKRSYTRYGVTAKLMQPELESMYRDSWLSKKIVNIPAEDMTRAWRTVAFDDASSPNLKLIEQAEKRLCVQSKFSEALRWARLYGGCCIIIGTKDGEFEKPLEVKTIKKGDLKWLHVADRYRLTASGTVTADLDSANFGLPDAYTLADNGARIHHSRIIRFNGQKLPYYPWIANAYWDDSELQHVVDSVKNCAAASNSVASMMFEANVDIIKMAGLTDLLSTKDGEAKVIKRFASAALLKSFNRTLLLDESETYEKKSNTFSGLNLIMQQFVQDVCGAADIPMTRMFGQSAGGLNATGDSDIRNYYDMISARQNSELRPQLERLDEIMVRSELGVMPDDFSFTFGSLWQMSDTEKATMQKTNAERDQIYLTNGVIGEGVIAAELKENGTYSTLTDEDVELAQALTKPLPEETEPAKTEPLETD